MVHRLDQRGGLGNLPVPFVVLYLGACTVPAFPPSSSKVVAVFLVFLYLVHNLPQLCMHIVILSPLHLLDHGESKGIPEKHLLLLH